MSSRLNLNDNTSDRFEFTIGGLDYDFIYPTLEEINPITDIYKEREVAENAKETEKLAEIDERLTNELYKLVVPVGHQTPIKETLQKQPFPVVKAFNKMMTEQLSAE